MATIEPNQMRRAHRVTVPLTIVINKKAYKTKDWSMTGAGIEGFAPDMEIGETIDASIVLAMKNAKLEIPVKLKLKVKGKESSGFEFIELSEQNKGVLRKFLELSIEGRLDQTDALLSIYHEPIIDTPITESIVLSDAEESTLKQAFQKRAKLYIQLGIAFFILILLTIYYNTSYVYRSIGTVTGNFVKVSPAISGKLKYINVHVGEIVHPKDLLFELDDKMILNQLDIIEEKIADTKSLSGSKTTSTTIVSPNKQLVHLLKKQLDKEYKNYLNAQMLYRDRLITYSDFQVIATRYENTQIKYYQAKKSSAKKTVTQSTNTNIFSFLTELKLRREELINKLNYLHVFSEVRGRIYAIKSKIGNFVNSSDNVMVIETPTDSFVVCKVNQAEALGIHKNMEVKIYAPSTNTTYDAYVQTVGNLALNIESEITSEVSLKEVTVKIMFKNTKVRLPLNERVKVWFYRPLF
ncbi:HlyD family efflux transporter periplasmic adaptor subunit [Sulfurimonas sp. SWIR-19]|uniref:HlyD family efflux transporter periplasmic adaptor subunit n=1 Tax=Sulfurimonas sp. SWIR-19 TaxID=2878390 RepID=UPI001CF16787|nr:HlyD family efflux transporter periplasmic adaptor subunit [Sulfurimonas sp. SWIR-19]UCM99437.1 HlyD family efflux transporter periplasmic adaptor subunit [Sulfurimonas sp. SWIR-19]